jgi:hypothetical protein
MSPFLWRINVTKQLAGLTKIGMENQTFLSGSHKLTEIHLGRLQMKCEITSYNQPTQVTITL